jgi:hypothetical protein
MSKRQPIEVTSHVARDFLQNAAYFNTMPKLVWEYVANSLDAAKDGVPAVVVIEITSHGIRVSDNGCGMSREELSNFFQMHGENIQRKRGKRVRGRFGTGKCAAFGLANYLRIDTTQLGLRNVVELHRRDIEQAQSGAPFPVQDMVIDEPTDAEDGTIIEIREFNIARPNVDKVISYLERHLSRYRKRAHVSVNGHVCKFEEPPFVEQFELLPPPEVAKHIGKVSLLVKVSPVPLDEDTRGLDILSHGIWHETTLISTENKERANHIFGEIDVPILEDGEWPIPAFDNTRNNILNRQNPVVVVLLGWLSEELEKIRLDLVRRERERRKSEMAKQLAKEAERISNILNEDFAQQEMELELTRRVSKRSGDKSVSEILDEQGELWPGDGDEPTPWEQTGTPHGQGTRADLAGEGDAPRPGPTARPGHESGARKATTQGWRKRRQAVFSIEYEHVTAERSRSRYDGDTKTIFINLDHPQIARVFEAGGKSTDARQFREICYEVAAVEYAIALPHEKLEKDELYHASDALFDVKDTIDRVTKRFMQILHS